MRGTLPYHPLLAALAPVLLLLSVNMGKAPPGIALRTAAVSIALVLIIWTIIAVKMKSIAGAAAPTTVVALLGTTLMPTVWAVTRLASLDSHVLRWITGGTVAVASLLVAALVARRVLRPGGHKDLNRAINLLLACIVIVPFVNIARLGLLGAREVTVVSPPLIEKMQPQHRPDVYYIIPDGYGRTDVLHELYGYDNGDFLQVLDQLGFVVCSASTANYCQTSLSLASSMNMSYLNPPHGDVSSTARGAAYQALLENPVMATFTEVGYTTVAYSSGYAYSELRSADRYYTVGPNEFERTAAQTFLRPLWWALRRVTALEYERTTGVLRRLGEERTSTQPVFVVAHLVAPHPPFVFNNDGSWRFTNQPGMLDGSHRIPHETTLEDYRSDYISQLQGFNKHLVDAIQRIMKASDEPPIIIIQSDHGPGSQLKWDDPAQTDMRERLAILNAYLVPREVQEALYSEITPVNSFRLILNYCLGIEIPLTEDRAFFSTWSRPYDFIDVTDQTNSDTVDQTGIPCKYLSCGGEAHG